MSNAATSAAPVEPDTDREGTNKRGASRGGGSGRRALALLIGLAVLAASGWWLYRQLTHVFVNDARVAADMVVLSSRVPGWVTAIAVTEGDAPGTGTLLVSIDSRDSRLMIEEFDARLAGIASQRDEIRARIRMSDRQTASRIKAQEAAIRAAQAVLTAATSQRRLAQRQNDRSEALAPSGVLPAASLDMSRAALEAASQQISSAQASLENARAVLAQAQADREEIAVLERQLAVLEPQRRQLLAQRERAQLDERDRTIMMPFDGVVDRVFVDVGEFVSPGQRLLMLHDPQRIRIEANVKETDIRYFRLGESVDIHVDSLPDQRFEGRVAGIGQAATSEFALLPNPNPSGNFTKITQRLRVRVDVQQHQNLLKPGMMVELELRARE